MGVEFEVSYHSFEDLEVWKRGCRLSVLVYEVLKDCKNYGLKDQMTRAAVSISSNIAEGTERDSKLEFVRFLHIAKGSAAELRTQVIYSASNWANRWEGPEGACEELKAISAMLHALIKSIKIDSSKAQNLKPKT